MATVPAFEDDRASPRDAVLHRTRLRDVLGRVSYATVVNLSEGGLMARTDEDWTTGDRLTIDLPVVGRVAAEVRWALGGRIGCRFERPVERYPQLLAAMR